METYKSAGWLLLAVLFFIFWAYRKDAEKIEFLAFDKSVTDKYEQGRAYERWKKANEISGGAAFLFLCALIIWIIALAEY